MSHLAWSIPTALAMAAGGGYAVREALRRNRVRRRRGRGFYWSIGTQRSDSPLRWNPAAATLHHRGQVDAGKPVLGMADPFLIQHDQGLYLFYELIFREEEGRARIAVSRHDPARDAWEFQGIALEEPFHLSYPYVFRHGAETYLVPESKSAGAVRLYRATDFPLRWEFVAQLIEGRKLVDPSLVCRDGIWYLFASRRRHLKLFVAPRLEGPWTEHPRSPVRRRNYARGAGRILEDAGALYRFAQEQRGYGMGVHAFRITLLSPSDYREDPVTENPVLRPGAADWCRTGMHHLDVLKTGPGQYLGVFDGEGCPVRVCGGI